MDKDINLKQTKPVETMEGNIIIAFVGLDNATFDNIYNAFQERVGYTLLRVDSVEQLEKTQLGVPETIVTTDDVIFNKLPANGAPVLTIANQIDLDRPDVISLSSDIKGPNRFKKPISYFEDAIDQITENALSARRKNLLTKYTSRLEEILNSPNGIDEEQLMTLFSEKDTTTYNHIVSTVDLTSTILLGVNEVGLDLSDEEKHDFRTVALIHDIGKLFTPDQLIKNSDAFSGGELTQMEKHVDVSLSFGLEERVRELIDIAQKHHYRYGGGGYLDQSLTDEIGDKVPVMARMMTVIDAFDAITARDRSYQPKEKGSKLESAINILYNNSHERSDKFRFGGQFDPKMAHAFLVGFQIMFNDTTNAEFRDKWLEREGLSTTIEEKIERIDTINNLLNTNINKLQDDFNLGDSNRRI